MLYIASLYLIYLFIFVCVFYSFIFFGHVTCGILIPQLGIEPRPTAEKAPSPNRWTTREFLYFIYFKPCSLYRLIFLPYHTFSHPLGGIGLISLCMNLFLLCYILSFSFRLYM